MIEERPVQFWYCNHEGKVSLRRVLPNRVWWGSQQPWHPEPGWLLDALDVEKGLVRTFALRNMITPMVEV